VNNAIEGYNNKRQEAQVKWVKWGKFPDIEHKENG
jgi:hypothetical protein